MRLQLRHADQPRRLPARPRPARYPRADRPGRHGEGLHHLVRRHQAWVGFPRTRPLNPPRQHPTRRFRSRILQDLWNLRASGYGVMIYWHVERGGPCVYSQLKSCFSSEVAAMIEPAAARHRREDRSQLHRHPQGQPRGVRLHRAARLHAPAPAEGHRRDPALRPKAGQIGWPTLEEILKKPPITGGGHLFATYSRRAQFPAGKPRCHAVMVNE
jgi:Tn3 transposase DDE domain